MLKRGVSFLLFLCLLLSLPAGAAALEADPADDIVINTDLADVKLSNNAGAHYVDGIGMRSSPGRSFLYANEKGGLTIVSYYSASVGICVVEVDENLQFLNTRLLPVTDLHKWGGFCASAEYNFVAYATSKTDLRVEKYTKDWTLASTRTYQIHNTSSLISNDLEMAEHNGRLFIVTNHIMSGSHQANVQLEIDTATLNLLQENSGISNYPGYVSHSFVPEIAAGGGYVYTFDMCDAVYPAVGIILNVFGGSLSSYRSTRVVRSTILQDWGNIGSAAATSTGVLLAYNYAPSTAAHTATNVYLYYGTPFGSANAKQVTYGGGAGTPYVAPLSDTSGFVLWNPDKRSRDEPNDRLYYAAYSLNSGSLTVRGYYSAENHYLSDCTPILFQDKVTWYTFENKEIIFHQIDANGVVTRTPIHSPVETEAVAPTYTSPGCTVGTKCSLCGEFLVQPEVLPKLEVTVQSAHIQEDTMSISFQGQGEESFQLVAAFFDANQRFLSAHPLSCQAGDETVSLPLPAGCASYAIFPANESYSPIGQPLRDTIK